MTKESQLTIQAPILIAAGVRSFTTGLTGVALGLYLAQLGLSPFSVGVVIALGLAGNALGTAVVAGGRGRVSRRKILLILGGLTMLGFVVLALSSELVPLSAAALVGMLNGMGRDRGPAQTVEQSLLADTIEESTRTAAFSRYSVVQDLVGGLGALAAAAPVALVRISGVSLTEGYRLTFAGAGVLSLLTLVLYLTLPRAANAGASTTAPVSISTKSKRRIAGLAALFALDSVGGGFLAGSILSYWFFQRFGLGGEILGPVFLVARMLNAASYFGAERLAARIGLLHTMVFTHLPSSLVLLPLPWVGGPWVAVTLFLVRESLVQMDVPTRQSYIAAVTRPGERTFAMGITALTRNTGWATGPSLAGAAMAAFGVSAPLIIGAALKLVYDVALYRAFREVRSEK